MLRIQIGKWFSLRIGRLPARPKPQAASIPYDRPKLVDDYLQDILTRETK